MDRSKLLSYLKGKRTQDYSYAIAFFLLFSFFVFALIRPNIVEIFSSFERISQMEKVDSFYEEQIGKSLNLQQSMENLIDKTYLLNDAMTTRPKVNKLLDDIKISLDRNSLQVEKMNISDINVKDSGGEQKPKAVTINLTVLGDYPGISRFMNDLYTQRRIKLIKNVKISKDVQATASGSAQLQAIMLIEGYYL